MRMSVDLQAQRRELGLAVTPLIGPQGPDSFDSTRAVLVAQWYDLQLETRETQVRILPWASSGHVTTKTDEDSTRSAAAARRSGAAAESMRCEASVTSARDSSHEFTPQGVKLLSSATTGKATETGSSRTLPFDLPAPSRELDYPIDVPATPTLPDANFRNKEALDWSKWTKGGHSFLQVLLSAQF